jgi:hypothetical protein
MPATSPTNGTHPDHTPSTAPTPDAKPPAADGGRDTHGRFAKGNAGGPGNPFARQVAALRTALLATVTEQDMEEVARALVRQAKEGNLAAAKLLLSYTLGKPAAPVDPDTLDQQEWELYRRLPDPAPEMAAAPQRVGLPLALKYLRAVLPAVAESQQRLFAEEAHAREFEEQLEAAAREERRQRRAAKKARQAAGKAPAPAAAAPKAEAAAPPPPPPSAPQPPAVDEAALALVARLLELTTPSANGGDGRPASVKPPSANGRAHPDGGGEANRT